ncbi:MAG: ATP-binding protein [Chromatiaceae bacterium]
MGVEREPHAAYSAQGLLEELNASNESPRIETKRAREIGKSILETVIAFANEPGMSGGWLLLGTDWAVNAKGDTVYRSEGVPTPDKLQQDLASQCASLLNYPLRPKIGVERIEGKTLVVVYVAKVHSGHKPVYLKATGLPRGAFRRIGSTDQRCTAKICGCCAATPSRGQAPTRPSSPTHSWTTSTPPRWPNTAGCATA